MMKLIDKSQQKTINYIIVAVGILTAITGILAYRENKKHNKIAEENLKLEKEIKKTDESRYSGLWKGFLKVAGNFEVSVGTEYVQNQIFKK